MLCPFLQKITRVFLIFSMLHYEYTYLRTSGYAAYSNSSDEISNIFSLPLISNHVSKGAPGTGNFAEGGLINENLTQSLSRTSTKNFHENFSAHVNLTEKQNMKPYIYISDVKNTSHSTFEPLILKTVPRNKLIETGSNLFLGVPEVIHVNGASSIKPRKGVQYIKIVPRKGVENENEFLGNESCLWLNENKCLNAKTLENLKCVCCKEGNLIGKTIEQQASEDCKNCEPVDFSFIKKQICKNICCNPIDHDIHSLSTNQNTSNDYLNYQIVPSTEKKHHNLSEVINKVGTSNVLIKNVAKEEVETEKNSKKNSKLKPSVTKVPYDIEIVTNFLSDAQQKVFIPVVVSLFLLPLIGILTFFLWRRAKEYWDKRYYRRMDFLIDGMYHD